MKLNFDYQYRHLLVAKQHMELAKTLSPNNEQLNAAVGHIELVEQSLKRLEAEFKETIEGITFQS